MLPIQLNKNYEYANGIITPLTILSELPSGNRIFLVAIKRNSGLTTMKELHELHIKVLIERHLNKWLKAIL